VSPFEKVNCVGPVGVVAMRGTNSIGLTGSSVTTSSVHAFSPAEVGVNCTVRSTPESGLIGTGKVGGLTSVKSAHVGNAFD
jgi:hypothetical protein